MSLLAALLEVQRCRVDAVALAGRFRAVLEDVAEVGVTAAAQRLGADHGPAPVALRGDVFRADRLVEARPTGPRIEFGRGIEQRLPAADADVHPVLVVVPVCAAKGPLRGLLARHIVLLRGELLAPLPIALLNLIAHVRAPFFWKIAL